METNEHKELRRQLATLETTFPHVKSKVKSVLWQRHGKGPNGHSKEEEVVSKFALICVERCVDRERLSIRQVM